MVERVALPERLDTAAAVALAAELSQAPAQADIVLDASAVSHFGAQVVQVILSASKTVHAAGGTITCVDVTERATGQLRAMGLTPESLTEVAQ